MGLFNSKPKTDTKNTSPADNKGSNKKNRAKGKIKIPRTVQETLDWEGTYENGVFKIGDTRYSKSFAFNDISFKTKNDEDQEAIYDAYLRFLNQIGFGEDIFITFVNYKEDEDTKLASVLPLYKQDGFNVYREELSTVLKNNMSLSRNSISTKRYITVYVNADTVEAAMQRLSILEGELTTSFKKISGTPLRPLDLAERLEVINLILNPESPNFYFEHDAKGKTSIDYDLLKKQHLTTKDIVCPESLKFYSNRFEINERVGQAMYLDGIANFMDTNFLTEIVSVNFESVFTLHISAWEQADAIKKVHNQSVNIQAEVEANMDKRISAGKSPDMINADLRKNKDEIEALQDDILNRDQKMFYTSLSLCHFAENLKILKEQKKIIENSAIKYMCTIKPFLNAQERGFISSLPLGHDKLYSKRMLTTESLGVFIPFDEVNQFDKNGIYYGINAINKSLIVYDRTKGMNYNGLVLGSSGSGKSFSAKREMTSVILNKDANIYIIDPDGEYSPLADAFNGTVINISPGNGVYINPFDLDIDNSHDTDLNPITMKTDFIFGLLETMLGNGASLSPTQKAIVGRCIQQIYRPYLEHLAELPPDNNGRKRTIDREHCPTMQNLFDALLSQPQAEAQNLALVMETYTTGAFDTFAHRTNVNIDNRLVVFNIKNIGTNLKELALKVCMNEVWNRMINNRRDNKWTWFYVDEFHLLLSNKSTSEFLKSIWKRARKFYGVPTGITQNVEDLLASQEARAIINNTSFVYMLNQSSMDRISLQELLNLSNSDIEYITNVEPGHGIIYTGQQTIPFEDNFPVKTKLFEIMTTKAVDDI